MHFAFTLATKAHFIRYDYLQALGLPCGMVGSSYRLLVCVRTAIFDYRNYCRAWILVELVMLGQK